MMRASDYPRVCANCKWWVPACSDGDSYSEDGACHRYPPTVLDDEAGIFPTTDCDGWCGEFAIMQHPRVGGR
jgi:hypothetical protein|nr:MAG TPA: hypothetical protein [Caudoviricetes sp.]